jgi:hypothetical protein
MRSQRPEVVTLAKGTSNAHVKKIPVTASLDSCWLNDLATGAGFSPKKETISMMTGSVHVGTVSGIPRFCDCASTNLTLKGDVIENRDKMADKP